MESRPVSDTAKTETREFRQAFMPYCLERLDSGNYMILNRLYQCLGHGPEGVKFSRMTCKNAASLSWCGDSNLGAIYLYNDGCVPTRSPGAMAEYLKRVSKLMKYAVSFTRAPRALQK